MKKINLKETLQSWKPGNYLRELSIVIVGVFVTLAGTGFISNVSQEKQIKESMQMIKMELEENLNSINQAEALYLEEISFFRMLIQKQDSLQTIDASILEDNVNAPFKIEDFEYSEDTLEVLKNSALMQQMADKQFILKLLQAYKGCRRISENHKFYYENKQKHMARYMSQPVSDPQRIYKDIYEMWEARLQDYNMGMLIQSVPNTFDENPFIAPQKAIKEVIELIKEKY
jgi:hypothetical protein